MIDSSFEDKTHWSEEKEAIKTNKPLKFLLVLLKYTPDFSIFSFLLMEENLLQVIRSSSENFQRVRFRQKSMPSNRF